MLLLKLIEVDQPTGCVLYLLTRLGDKKPKVPIGCLDVIREAISSYGVKSFPVKDVLNALGPAFNSGNAEARDMAMSLLVELYKWVGKATQKVVDSLRTAQQESFNTLIASIAGQKPPEPTKRLRKDGPPPPPKASSIPSEDVSAMVSRPPPPSESVDAREFVDEVDLMKKLKGTDFASLVAAEKWDEQLKGLNLVIDAIGPTPKVKKGSDIGDIVAACKNFLRNGHLTVMSNAIKILALLADGMRYPPINMLFIQLKSYRAEFAPTARQMNETIVLKFKEKKLIPECHAYLIAAVKFAVDLSTMLDTISENARNKKNPPHMREGLLHFLATLVSEVPDKVSPDHMKSLAEIFIACCDESDPKVRESSASGLSAIAVLAKAKGSSAQATLRILNGLEQAAPKIFAKIKPALTGEVTGVPAGGPSKPAIQKTISEESTKPMPAPPAKTAGVAKKTSSGKVAADDDGPEDLALSISEAEEQLASLNIPGWAEEIQQKMAGGKWQEVVEALDAITKAIEAAGDAGKLSGAFVRYVEIKTTGFKVNNVNVVKAIVTSLHSIFKSSSASPHSKGAVAEAIKGLFDKLADKKVSDALIELFTAFAEATSAGFVFNQCKAAVQNSKSPVVHENFLIWLRGAVKEFGAMKFPVSAVGALCQVN